MIAYKKGKIVEVEINEVNGKDIITFEGDNFELEGPLEKTEENISYVFNSDTKLYIESDNYIEVFCKIYN